VAVRSSATAEDLPEAAFAGQQDTFLNVVGPEALLDAVRRCWASLWTDRAIAYRARLGLDQTTVKLAVVVQRMVDAEVAGVLFTANPVTGARDEIVIDASPGLGEAVVSGLVTPDHFVLRRRWWGWSIVERRAGWREVVVRPRAEGGTEHVWPEPTATLQPALPDHALRRLADLGAAIERHFGRPQDVEWAWARGEAFILQARPITALPERVPRLTRLVRLVAALLVELLPARPYPLEATTWGFEYFASALLGPMFRRLGLAVRFDRLFVEEDGVIVRFRGGLPFRPTPGVLLAPLRLWRLARRYDPSSWRSDPLLAEVQARVRALEALAAYIRSDPTLADTFARHEPGALWAALEAQPAGRTFLAELRAFLDGRHPAGLAADLERRARRGAGPAAGVGPRPAAPAGPTAGLGGGAGRAAGPPPAAVPAPAVPVPPAPGGGPLVSQDP
jgi:pyruvate,water dikinase